MAARHKRTKTSDTEIPLPEPLIHHIQSFLDAKAAARTTLLSKSWYHAWLTRPNIGFDERDFRVGGFWNFVKKTVQRYEDLNLKVESFKLELTELGRDSRSLAIELIGKVLKMGVRVVRLSDSLGEFVLPNEVLETGTLVRLSLCGLRFDLPPDRKMSCSMVKSLVLRGMMSIPDDLFSVVFPCLEDLTLEGSVCRSIKALNCPSIKSLFLDHISVRLVNLVSFNCSLPSLEDLTLVGCGDLLEALSGPRVKSLRLERMDIKEKFFSLSFPCLEDLRIERCHCLKALQISSCKLKCVILSDVKNLKAKFDVPSLRTFKISGSYFASRLPLLSFTKVLREWESVISLCIKNRHHKGPWCYQLRRFMRKFGESKVSLSIEFQEKIHIYDEELEGKRGPRPAVENLTLLNPSLSSACSDVLNGLLWSCRPKFITQVWFPRSCREDKGEASNEFIKLLCKELIHVRCSQNQNMPVSHDLKDVNVKYFDDSHAEWRPLLWKTLLSASGSPKTEQKICFQLDWCDK